MGNKQAKRSQQQRQPRVIPSANPICIQHGRGIEDSSLARDYEHSEPQSLLLEQEQCRKIIDHWFRHIFQNYMDTNLSNMVCHCYCDLDKILMCYYHAMEFYDGLARDMSYDTIHDDNIESANCMQQPEGFPDGNANKSDVAHEGFPEDRVEPIPDSTRTLYIVAVSGNVYKATDTTENIHDLDAIQTQYVNEQHLVQSLQLSHTECTELLSILIRLQINLSYHYFETGVGDDGDYKQQAECIVHTGKNIAERHGLPLQVYDRKDFSVLDVEPLLRFLKRAKLAAMGSFAWLQYFCDLAQGKIWWHDCSVAINEDLNTIELAEDLIYS